jgi:hypothetical protein
MMLLTANAMLDVKWPNTVTKEQVSKVVKFAVTASASEYRCPNDHERRTVA